MAENPAHGVAFAKAEAGWELTARLGEVAPSLAPETIAGPAGRFEALFDRRTFGWLLAASLAGMAATVTVQKWSDIDRYRTLVGQERAVRLADGSIVHLNTDSAIEVAMRDGRRFTRLLRGEASFDVAQDRAGRPFIVRANAVTFEVVGTKFNVRLRPDLTELTVMKGRVAVRDGEAAPRMVEAGAGAAIRGGTVAVTPLSDAQIARRIAWQAGKIRLDGETLAQAVEEFNRYRTAPLVIGDAQIGGLRLDGVFSAGRSDRFIAALERQFGIRAVSGSDRSIILLPADGRNHQAIR